MALLVCHQGGATFVMIQNDSDLGAGLTFLLKACRKSKTSGVQHVQKQKVTMVDRKDPKGLLHGDLFQVSFVAMSSFLSGGDVRSEASCQLRCTPKEQKVFCLHSGIPVETVYGKAR